MCYLRRSETTHGYVRRAVLFVQCRERLVHEEHFRVVRECARDTYSLAHPAGKVMWVSVGESSSACEAHILYPEANRFIDLFLGTPRFCNP